MMEDEQEMDALSLEAIMREFGSDSPEPEEAEPKTATQAEPETPVDGGMPPMPQDTGRLQLQELTEVRMQTVDSLLAGEEETPEQTEPSAAEDSAEAYAEESADEAPEQEEAEAPEDPQAPDALEDGTVRLDSLSDIPHHAPSEEPEPADGGEPPAEEAAEPEPTAPDDAEPEAEAEQPQPAFAVPTPPPIPFRPRSRIQELKRQLIEGPEKRYYELTETGVGKLQAAIMLCLLAAIFSVGCAAAYDAGWIGENRLRLMIFLQVLCVLFGGMLGSYQMTAGIGSLLHGKFTMNTLLAVTFAACLADSVLCLMELRIPVCAAFTLEVAMSLWSEYHRRITETGQMDTLRKAVRLESVVLSQDYYDGKPAFLRGEGRVPDFMENVKETSSYESTQNIFALICLCASAAVAVVAGVLHSAPLGVQVFSSALLVSVPAGCFVTLTRPMAVLERRLHALGTVLCGWQGIKGLRKKAAFPLDDADVFPTGTVKMNGVKFYGERNPEDTIAYAAALMHVNGGSLAPVFDQLLASRNGLHYEAVNMHYYGNGGIGGELCGEPVLMGSLDFLKEMGVEIPEGVMVKQAVYVSIDGDLSGLFAISYTRTKFATAGIQTLCANRRITPLMLTKDFMLTGPFLKEKFGANPRRVTIPLREEREALAEKKPDAEATALALTTQEGLAPAACAVGAARSLCTAWRMGLAVQLLSGILGILIMAALAVLGTSELLSPLRVLGYQLVWLLPSLLVTLWTRTI